MSRLSSGSSIEQAVALARQLQKRARELQTPAERRQQAELDRMIQSPGDKATLVEITDQAFRARLPHRAADQLVHILDVQGVPRFFSMLDRTLLRGFQSFGAYLPGVAMPLVKEKMQHETANVVLPAEEDVLREHLEQRRREGVRMNVNYLGEALLGEAEAQRRLQAYLAALARPEIEVISVKISTIYSQISPLARRHTVETLCDRLELLYRAAAKHRFRRLDGGESPKFVYLDMEEYRDKEITAEAFVRTLDRPGLEHVRAGIALQAYIPDSFATQQRITEWARRRVAAGGAPVTIRLVKGANMEMERVEASLKGWPLATFSNKLDTDANYHRMLRYGLQADNLAAVNLGVASHNLFTLAYGFVLAADAARASGTDQSPAPEVQFEMLEGMANHQRRALVELARNMLLYAPACKQDEFVNAIGYLIRRLDENTGPDNFLRYAFRLEVDSPEWRRLEQGFVDSFERIDSLPDTPRRTQNRRKDAAITAPNDMQRAGSSPSPASAKKPTDAAPPTAAFRHFRNEPDTDWSLPHNSEWAEKIVDAWRDRHGPRACEVPLVVGGEEILDGRETRESEDPSRPELVVARYRQASSDDVDRAVKTAAEDREWWRRRSPRARTETLFRVADELAAARSELMGAMLAEGGKTLSESDPEVSEAIDFCRFYALAAEEFYALAAPMAGGHAAPASQPSGYGAGGPPLTITPRGVVVVVSPWNFPLAIPCGGVAAGLAAGNTVILKPASDTVLVAYLLCECFWRAGVPRTALQFAPCSGATVGQQLVSHEGVDAVILTGGTETALAMLKHKPTMRLLAETGGKNATIVTALSDRDLAIKNVLHSAFSHSGQKCSATSLLILEEEVYHDAKFRDVLVDGVESLAVGSAWELPTKVGPLIRPPRGALERGLKELEAGETWAVMPRLHVDDNPRLVSPGVKWGVQRDSFTHCTELFGPVLGVMPARDLHEAIDLVNATGYGLTSGLESLDDREHRLWQEGVRAGNLYINRPTTGAIVLRQPFGGMGKSAFGPGAKAGGPNYVAPLMKFEDSGEESGDRRAESPAASIADAADLAFPAPPLALPREPIAQRRQQLHALRDALNAHGAAAGLDGGATARILAAIESYLQAAVDEFDPAHDHFRLIGEDNLRRYLPIADLRIRLHAADSAFDIIARAAASRAAGCRTVVSAPPDLPEASRRIIEFVDASTDAWAASIEFIEESDEQLAEAIRSGQVRRVRYAAAERVPELIRIASAESYVYHRYGNLGRRAEEPRAEVF